MLTFEQRKFLRRIVDYTGAAESHELPSASRQQDYARSKCKRDGLAYFDRPYWRITDAGRKALAASRWREDVSYDYIKRNYAFHPEVGRRVKHTVTKESGTIRRERKSQGHYVQVRFDGIKHNMPCHPDELEYID